MHLDKARLETMTVRGHAARRSRTASATDGLSPRRTRIRTPRGGVKSFSLP